MSEEAPFIDYRSLKTGDYELHVYIQETRGLVHPTDNSSLVDPIIKLTAFSKTQTTKTKYDRGPSMIYWGEHIFFNKKIEENEELQSEKLKIEVLDYNLIGNNALIGSHEIDLMRIYFSEEHCLKHQWAALSNYDKKFNEIKGFLKFSATLCATGDKQIELADEKPSVGEKDLHQESGKGNIGFSNILLPPQIQTKGYQLKINLLRAENLIQMDWGGSIDCYIVFEYGPARFVTSIIKSTKDPVWLSNIFIPFSEPNVIEHLLVKVFDWDSTNKDEIVGSSLFLKSDIDINHYKTLFWVNLYGSQKDGNEKYSAIMNANPDLGTFWKGRILMNIEKIVCENPKLDSQALPKNTDLQYSTMEFTIIAEVFYGIGFSEPDEKYGIQIRWADVELPFEKQKPNEGVWEWYQRKKIVCNFPYLSSHELPDIIIYVVKGDKRISYIRQSAKHFQMQLMSAPQLLYFKPDRSIAPDLRDDQAGIVKMRLTAGFSQALEGLIVGDWNKPIQKPVGSIGYLFVHLYHAQDLIPADNDGCSDPFCRIGYYGREVKTEIVEDSLNPIWNKSYELRVPMLKVDDSPPITIKIYDDDNIGSDFIGSVSISIEEGLKEGYLYINKTELPKPKWLQLKYNKSANAGRILASFSFLSEKPASFPPKLIQNYGKYYVKMKILGLRNLKSMGIFPVKRPIIKFDINSLKSSAEKQDLKEKKAIWTQPNYYGSNPNISTIINFELYLPLDVSLWPFMNCTVHDCILKSVMQPVLGTFSINLSELEGKTRERTKKNMKKFGQEFFRAIPMDDKYKILFQSKPALPQTNLQISSSPRKQKENYEILNEEKIDSSKQPRLELGPVITPEGAINSGNIVKKAEYGVQAPSKYPIEIRIPPSESYLPLGYDPKDKRLPPYIPKKHYRYLIDQEMEDSPFMDKNVFDEYSIIRGNRLKPDSIFMELLGLHEKEKEVGRFKGWIDVSSEENKKKMDQKLIVGKSFFEKRFANSDDKKSKKKFDLEKEFLEKNHVMVRVYVVSLEGLPPMDDDSNSDPYIEVVLGEQTKNNKNKYQKDVVNADIYTMFELKAILPGVSQLEIKVWDNDFLVKDDLIGQTVIDLENRFFSKKWRKLEYPPIETRNLKSPLSSVNRGRIKLWVELISVRDLEMLQNIWEIAPKPPTDFELRVVVWSCSDIPCMDVEETSDIFVVGRVGDKTLKTDTHYRSQNGEGSFNWRMVFPIQLPLKDSTISFQIFDKDIFSADDFISDTSLNFKNYADQAFENDCTVKVYSHQKFDLLGALPFGEEQKAPEGKIKGEEKEKVQIPLQNAQKDGYAVFKDVGKLVISFELVPGEIAKHNPVGQGRAEPNNSPWLPPPLNRFEWSWNPLTLFNRLIGPKARMKVCLCLCIIICCLLLIYILPSLIGSLLGRAMAGS